MTVVAGPPVEVQVRLLDRLLYPMLVTCGEPIDWQMMIVTLNSICEGNIPIYYRSKGNVAIKKRFS